jgi:flagellar export protein FliJ
MQKFKFTLETVRSHRTLLEERAMLAFAALQNEVAACTARIAALQLEFSRVVSSRPARLNVEELTLRERHLDGLRLCIENEERVREGLYARLEDARANLVSKRQDRETVDRLREIELAEHRKETDRREQESIDELATLRHSRGRAENGS